MKKRVAQYIRVSTTKQDYQRQIDELDNYCKVNDYDVIHRYEEKMSGAVDERLEFTKMCMLDKSDIDIVLCWELSRLGRKMSTVIKVVEDFAKKQIGVVSLKENFRSLDDDGNMTPSTIMMLSFGSAMAQIERTTIIERTQSGRKNKLMSGKSAYTSKAPLGYRLDDNRQLVIDDANADKVRDMFEMYINGSSCADIASVYKSSPSIIHYILSNEAYTGRKHSNIIDTDIVTPAIIERDKWLQIQDMLKKRKIIKKSVNTSPLRKKLYCSVCGGMMSKHGGEKHPAWQCKSNCTSIIFRFTDKATEVALDHIKNELGYESIRSDAELHINSMYNQARDMSELVDDLYDKVAEETKKLEVLKDVFSVEQLKREVNDVKALEKERDRQEQMLQNLFAEIHTQEAMLEDDRISVASIDKIMVSKVNDHSKLLTYYIMGRQVGVLVDYLNRKNPNFVIFKVR